MDARESKPYGVTLGSFGQISAPKEAENPDEDFGRKMFADFYRENVPRLLADAGFRAALDVIRQRQKEGLCRAERGQGLLKWVFRMSKEEYPEPVQILEGRIMDMVPFFAALAVGKSASKKNWESLWTIGTGKTWKSLRDFPRRLRAMADEVKQLNKSPFFCPEHAIPAKTPSANFAKIQFGRLPAHLSMYATWIDVWTGKIPTLMGRHLPSPPGRGKSVYDLSLLIWILTGRFHDNEVSNLLNAADLALNPESQQREPRFHPQTLADLRSRQKRKTSKT